MSVIAWLLISSPETAQHDELRTWQAASTCAIAYGIATATYQIHMPHLHVCHATNNCAMHVYALTKAKATMPEWKQHERLQS